MPSIPTMTLHAASGQARVRVPARLRRPGDPSDLYLGQWGSQEAHRRYAAFLTDILGERVPAEIASRAGAKVLVCELAAAYRQHLETELVGRTEAAVRTARSKADVAIELLVERHHAVRVQDFDAAMLEDIKDRMRQAARWNWRVAAGHLSTILSIFRWGIARKMTPRHLMVELETVRLPRQGSPGWRPIGPRTVAPLDHVRMVIDDLNLRGRVQVAGILTVQTLTGSRCGEIRQARQHELDRDRMRLVVHQHKTVRFTGEPKVIPIGEMALAAIDRAILASGIRDPEAAIFTSKRGRGEPLKANGVRAAIETACDRLGIPTFTPHAIRRMAATELRQAEGADVAQATGHWSKAEMMRLYGAEAETTLARRGTEALERRFTA